MSRIEENKDIQDLSFIEKLPDCVLVKIISLVPYKESARTTVLSKRWLRVFPSQKVVIFDEKKLGLGLGLGFPGQGKSSFSEFHRNLMQNYKDPSMEVFSVVLSRSSPRDLADELRDCVVFAAEKKTKVMSLDFSSSQIVEEFDNLPEEVYRNDELEVLRLFSCGFDETKFRTLDSLSHLSLGRIEILTPSIRALVQNCASLKSLRVEECRFKPVFEIKGRDSKLESLIIDDCDVEGDWIEISAPNLKLLEYSGEFRTIEIERAWNLEEVCFDFGSEVEYGEAGDLLSQLFGSVYAVRVLTVCSYTLQVITSGEEPMGLKPRLTCVKHLILKTSMHANEFYGIRFFLNTCPSLETITFEIDQTRRIFEEYESPFSNRWDQRIPVYRCVMKTLKVVDVKGFRGSSDEFGLLAYFVGYGRVMQSLKIEVGEGSETIGLHNARVLNRVKKASPNLCISIY